MAASGNHTTVQGNFCLWGRQTLRHFTPRLPRVPWWRCSPPPPVGDAGEAAWMVLTMAVLSSVGFTRLESSVSSSLDAVERSDTEGVG